MCARVDVVDVARAISLPLRFLLLFAPDETAVLLLPASQQSAVAAPSDRLPPASRYFCTSCFSGFWLWCLGPRWEVARTRCAGAGVDWSGCSATFVSPAVNLAPREHILFYCSLHELGVMLSCFVWQPRFYEMIWSRFSWQLAVFGVPQTAVTVPR